MPKGIYEHKKTPIVQRFETKFQPEPNTGCWLWFGDKEKQEAGDGGYGRMRINGKYIKVHRIAWELFRGPVPAGLHVLHKCDVRLCVNPDHLFLGTIGDNNRDRHLKGRTVLPYPGLSVNQVDYIRSQRALGIKQAVLAAELGVCVGTISLIDRGKTWR